MSFCFQLFLDIVKTLLKPLITLQLPIIRNVIIFIALPWWNMPVHDFPENGDHGIIIKFINGDHVKMSQEARGHRVPATTWWAHGCHDLDVNQFHGRGFLQVIPVPVIQPLSQQLNRRLSSKLLQHGHVQIIHKHNLQQQKNLLNLIYNVWFRILESQLHIHKYIFIHAWNESENKFA